ncbi:hypothetical protein LPJ61_005875 [Coemansia biformis]|uniref:Splicing factor subunit n=1 Tax=Coemansia biformis TaxID=1286918 RepID=A0A9W7Y1H0_9FUNG|nr:hypothetical protein LPJ61_005875 [Coemansia biformis]
MDKFGMHNQTEHMFARYAGTGHADTTRHQWLTSQHRDTLAHYVADDSLAMYIAMAEGESVARVKSGMLQRMRQPCGPPPAKDAA